MKKGKFIFLCSGKDCKKAGAEEVKKELKTLKKQHANLSELTVIKTHCIDKCKKGPNLIFKDHVYHEVSKDDLLTRIIHKDLL